MQIPAAMTANIVQRPASDTRGDTRRLIYGEMSESRSSARVTLPVEAGLQKSRLVQSTYSAVLALEDSE